MTINVKNIALSTAIFCVAPSISWAGGVATILSQGTQTNVEYDGSGSMRMSVAGEEGYMVLRDGSLYSVVGAGEGSMVFDVGQSMAAMGGLMEGAMGQSFFDADFQEVLSFSETGRSETIAGIPGRVYEMRAIDRNGQPVTETVVLSTDRSVYEMTEAMLGMLGVLVQALGEEMESYTFIQREVLDKGLGVLRQGTEFSVSRIDSTTPPAARFELPAAPMEIPAMDGLFDGGMPDMSAFFDNDYDLDAEGRSGGESALPGAVSDQIDRQQRRVENRTEREIDRAADNAVDRTVDRVFRRIFGN